MVGMYIVAIGWIYVTLLMALTEPNLIAGILTFGLYGLAPLALFLWLFGTPQRRRNQRAREASADEAIDQVVPPDDRTDAEKDERDLGDRRP
jgi:hypothetical protein